MVSMISGVIGQLIIVPFFINSSMGVFLSNVISAPVLLSESHLTAEQILLIIFSLSYPPLSSLVVLCDFIGAVTYFLKTPALIVVQMIVAVKIAISMKRAIIGRFSVRKRI